MHLLIYYQQLYSQSPLKLEMPDKPCTGYIKRSCYA
uniref:Uncharacterized protein n=1 Tax=Arundo donax TaxID=35708 RepID=A0A0A8Z6A8_ARUDO